MIRNEKLLKGCFKRKVSVNMSLLVGFMIMGHAVMGATYRGTLETDSNKYKSVEAKETKDLVDEETKKMIKDAGGWVKGKELNTKTFEFQDGDTIKTKGNSAIKAINCDEEKIVIKNVDIKATKLQSAIEIENSFVELRNIDAEVTKNAGETLRLTDGLLVLNNSKIDVGYEGQNAIVMYGDSMVIDGEGSAQIMGSINKEDSSGESFVVLTNKDSLIEGQINGEIDVKLYNGASWIMPENPREILSSQISSLDLGEDSSISIGKGVSELSVYKYEGNGDIWLNNLEVENGRLGMNYRNPRSYSFKAPGPLSTITVYEVEKNSSINLKYANMGENLIDTSKKWKLKDSFQAMVDQLSIVEVGKNTSVTAYITEGFMTRSAKITIDGHLLEDMTNGRPIQSMPKSIMEMGDEETASMKALEKQSLLNVALWRDETTLRQRLGNIRYKEEGTGVWARVKSGKGEYDGVENDYNFVQVGWDKKQGQYNIGGAFSHSEGDLDYDIGSGDTENFTLSLYATKLYDNGCYMDYVAKIGKLDTDFDTIVDFGITKETYSGDYSNKAIELSVERGKEIMMRPDFYIKPYGKLSFMHVKGDDYNIDKGGISVDQKDINNLTGKLGVEAVKKLQKGGEVYAKLELGKEFTGEVKGTLRSDGVTPLTYKEDMNATWTEVGFGFDKKVKEDLTLYGEVNKSFGGDYEKDWEAQIGFKYKF